jgi:putative transposase
LTLKFLDQTGLSLMLSLCKSWFPRGSGRQFEVPTRWGSQGRLNLIGTLAVDAQGEHLEVRELTASCTQDAVIAYLDTLAAQSEAEQRRLGKPRLTVVVLDNASFHRGEAVRAREPVWAEKGMLLRYLPPYCPMLNRIETTWRVLKGFLMPRRCYDTVAELRAALLIALNALGATII